MPLFRVRAWSPDGELRRATIEATSMEDAARQISAQELDIESIELADDVPRRLEPYGPRPEDAPRELTRPVKGVAGEKLLLIIGGGFTLMGGLFVSIGLASLVGGHASGLFFALFPMIHLAIGLAMLLYVWRGRQRRTALYREGEVAVAVVDRVGFDRSVRINGRNPYEIGWTFYVDDRAWHGKRSSMNEGLTTLGEGDRLWVLYDPDDPASNAEWPPL